MRCFLNSIFTILLAGSLAAAQTTPPKPTLTKRPEKPAASGSTNLPSEATVDSFLHQQFGYQPDLTWKISSIKPSINHRTSRGLCRSRQPSRPAVDPLLRCS